MKVDPSQVVIVDPMKLPLALKNLPMRADVVPLLTLEEKKE